LNNYVFFYINSESKFIDNKIEIVLNSKLKDEKKILLNINIDNFKLIQSSVKQDTKVDEDFLESVIR
jgi:hypothetical protein